jgi:hypothetical protein
MLLILIHIAKLSQINTTYRQYNWQRQQNIGIYSTQLKRLHQTSEISSIYIHGETNKPVLVVEEAGVPGENHRPWASNWYKLSLAAASRVHPFCNLQRWARTLAAHYIGIGNFKIYQLNHAHTLNMETCES